MPKYTIALSIILLIASASLHGQSLAYKTTTAVNDTSTVIFSHHGGFYPSTFNLKLQVPDQSYSIVYTIDGSNPQYSATSINGGKTKTIVINPLSSTGRPKTPCYIVRASLKKIGSEPTFPITHTYIFIDQVIKQEHPGGIWPAEPTFNGQRIDLNMDPDVTNNPLYSSLIDDALTDIPSISVVTDLENLFDVSTGIYVNAMEDGREWERFCSVELIDPTGKPGFNINAGLRIRGGWSRHGNYPKHAFRLFFREEYGASKLKFPLFDDEGVDEYDKIDLRCEQNYSWAHPGDDRSRNTCVREVFARDTQRDMGQPYTRSRYYHLYLNGMYWGLFQTQERSEARFASDYLGGSSDDYDVVKVNTNGYSVEATDGTIDSWEQLYYLCEEGFASNSAYFALEGKDRNGYAVKGGEVLVNIDNLIDYMCLIFYIGSFDSPVSSFRDNSRPNNFYAIDRRDDKSEGFVFFAHDAEHAMMIDPAYPGKGLYENRVQLDMTVNSLYEFHPQWLHYKLSENKEYRQRFSDRAYNHFFNKGVFVHDIARERFQKRTDEIDVAIIAESARWGDAQERTPYTRDDWEAEINDIYDRFFPFRNDIVIDQLIDAELFSNIQSPEIKLNNTLVDAEVYTNQGKSTLSLRTSSGAIYYTLDGTDPRQIGGGVSKTALQLGSSGDIEADGTTWLKARVKAGDRWSPLRNIRLINPIEDFTKLKVTELHYHPTDSIIGQDTIPGQSFEFFELKNTGDKPINLSGLMFSTAIQYQYEGNEVLAPKQFHVIASKPKWFYERHGKVPSGNFQNNFSNSGEQVTIISSQGTEVINFTYSDQPPWPSEADGDGYTLSARLRYPEGSPNDQAYWTVSALFDGSPFADDQGIFDSIDEKGISTQVVSFYPNPTKGFIRVKFNELINNAILDIYSIQGKKILETYVADNSTIDLNNLPVSSGILFFKVKTDGKTSVTKIYYQP